MTHKKRFNFAKLTKEIGHDLGKVAKEVIETPEKLLDKGIHGVEGVANSLTLPLLVIGGVVLFVYIKNK